MIIRGGREKARESVVKHLFFSKTETPNLLHPQISRILPTTRKNVCNIFQFWKIKLTIIVVAIYQRKKEIVKSFVF